MQSRENGVAELPTPIAEGVNAPESPMVEKALRCARQQARPTAAECWLCEQPKTQELLSRIVARVNHDAVWRDDLFQEGMIHLWLIEQARPHQSLSWYMKSCQYHLRDYMAMGRSIDSWKRRQTQVSLSDQEEDEQEPPSLGRRSEDTLLSEIGVLETMDLLRQRLTDKQHAVLVHLAEGLSSREIASKLSVSHKAVIKHRRKIASVAIASGITLTF
jgi:RNA polymerase sigma factor (sigma-70 family)